ncbi:MAG: Amidophosphoribosyltransferase-like protein [Candidatus Wolfebacteria bacterium GW2011_GWC2_46_275]|uniref:Amidophosphoribosyltransferase-like protein n=2 Tax=Candidatus Wolfeibacteriota TaxID=1752735 RepID=A0A0G1X7W7_9BACT|nr:MAG: amidophosphoribosyltransferase-like protein [Candidatus Wolfebacteria bacterium GW2011_GWB1_47_1]KKU37171.1 MAG: Amidophosphoribosyltransferase-like protein [Candidatus Wolfebacteria bacterium GW2011_GWC2_46_275]KKU42669.1 MAG: Amidophosphoribosyltransferase-like protein [Candidatus Wolfebacteria bacterium GW2011_GWB2_46_69]KKU54596.1 MAG: Amidophosphoribosyltransferase-like protein [Candidatus Wolfebacteria bacterium GW2011_GWC1_47_103]KKU59980.1 MAG: Amidophosphoribosyltransferase-lik
MIRTVIHFFFNILFPPLCVNCEMYMRDSSGSLCDNCYTSIEKCTTLTCPICKTRLAHNRRICNHSVPDARRFPYLLGSATLYMDPVIKNCIYAYKYQGIHALSEPLARLLIEYAQNLNPHPSLFDTAPIVIPIPLHVKKKRKRGFNQSALIAKSFASALKLPYDELLIKIVHNDAQAQTKTHHERFAHMMDAFIISRPECVWNKNIILIDDVSTSGATLSEAAQTLKAAGAKQILALVIARA